MLESVLADVLTRVLGQYLQGIDRDSVNFGAWSGRIELRGVALRPEALAVLFETLGMELPVTVEAGFIGLLQLVVPWKSIGTTPVQIHMRDVTIIARPVRGDGSDDSQLRVRDRRIKRAKLNTDDAVREASWGVTAQQDATGSTASSWSSWLVSDELRATIIENIQIHLSDINIRFEDPFSDPRAPYIASIVCDQLKAVSANRKWEEAFVERSPDTDTRKLLQVTAFRVNWAPIVSRQQPTSSGSPSSASTTAAAASTSEQDVTQFKTPELLKEFLSSSAEVSPGLHEAAAKSLLHPVNGFMRMRLAASPEISPSMDFREQKPSVDLDIRFPDVLVDLTDVQYACLLQTSVYFARLATRGFRPSTPKARWVWAADQLLPGLSDRRKRALRFTESGLVETRNQRDLYIGHRASILKARRTGVDEPKEISAALEKMEDEIDFAEILSYRDAADIRVQSEAEKWALVKEKAESSPIGNEGTTTSSFWSMLGYSNSIDTAGTPAQLSTGSTSAERSTRSDVKTIADRRQHQAKSSVSSESLVHKSSASRPKKTLSLRAAFLLRNASVRISEGGFPREASPRVMLSLKELQVGVMYSSRKDLILEAVLGTIEAWDIQKNTRMVYNRQAPLGNQHQLDISNNESSYPWNVSDAIEGIRCGSNPARDVLFEEAEISDDEDMLDSKSSFFDDGRDSFQEDTVPRTNLGSPRGPRTSRDTSPPPTFRVTESEFLGNPTYSGAQKYVAAFRYAQAYSDDTEHSTRPVNSLDVSVATLEAVVDGPKGSFLWGLKFWQPKGLAQDPIMAFLGAAAGARIAELRMELEAALLANTVPMQLNAVILAPRFIIPSSSEAAPAFVVNMGTLGIITSDGAHSEHAVEDQRNLRYSNYILTLDDLGMYFSPNLTSAVSRELNAGTAQTTFAEEGLMSPSLSSLNTTDVERIIRPFSLRFILQTLRDSTVVQVAHGSRAAGNDGKESIAKVRIRGTIPDLSLILTQRAFQHLVVTLRTWGEELRPSSLETVVPGWKEVPTKELPTGDITPQLKSLRSPEFTKQSSVSFTDGEKLARGQVPSTLAAYNIKVMVQSVCVELRENVNVRLVTAVASRLSANLVKRGKTKLHADLTLKNWSITDGSRGSTAAFRRLLYAGTPVEEEQLPQAPYRANSSSADTNFVNIRYTLDFAKNEQRVNFNFLSLHVVCVRETYLKLVSFFDRVRKYARNRRRSQRNRELLQPQSKVAIPPISLDSGETNSIEPSAPTGKRIVVVSEFDGFTCQLVASGGVVAVYEMRSSRIFYRKERDGFRTANGYFRQLFVRDMTAPLPEHVPVIAYEKFDEEPESEFSQARSSEDSASPADGWELQFPTSKDGHFLLRASLKNVQTLFLTRFSEVLRQYFSVLMNRVKPIVSTMVEEVSADLDRGNPQSSNRSQRTKYGVDLRLRDLVLRLPRHSLCQSEAVQIELSEILVLKEHTSPAWNLLLQDIRCAVLYSLPGSSINEELPTLSNFLAQDSVEVYLQSQEDLTNESSKNSLSGTTTVATVRFPSPVNVFLSEAQYTVLYFVMMENFAESITGDEITAQLDLDNTGTEVEPFQDVAKYPEGTESTLEGTVHAPLIPLDSEPGVEPSILTSKIEVDVPAVTLEISRGWDVKDSACKIIRISICDVSLRFKRCTPKRLIFEIQGTLLSATDLRSEGQAIKNFIVGLRPDEERKQTSSDGAENVSVTYDKVGTGRPSIFIFLSNLQLELIPELFRDLSCLAIPGWPFLPTSQFPPEFVYIGRTMTILLNDTQVFLANDSKQEQGALVFTGEFEAKLDWMRGTGAKTISLRSNQLEISAINDIEPFQAIPEPAVQGTTRYIAKPFKRTQSPLLYPTDSYIEYVGPHVDDAGRRLNISVDAALCMVCASDVPIVNAVLGQLRKLDDSYLSNRDWSQPTLNTSPSEPETPKQEHTRKALQSLNLSLRVPAARFLVTNDIDGHFVPVVEVRQSGFVVSAHGNSMVQVAGQFSVDLFNPKKGWWEPALEPWTLSASLSRGQSGTRAFVVRSEERMNVNFAPTTVTAVLTVGRAFKKAMSRIRTETDHQSGAAVQRQEVQDPRAHRPTVAAFLVINQLGVPFMMSIPGNPKPKPIPHGVEVEVGAQSENLLSSSTNGPQSRESALRCSIKVGSYLSRDFSAAQVGKHPVSLQPQTDLMTSVDELQQTTAEEKVPLPLLWEVEMRNGVPVCKLRSRFQVVNRTLSDLHVVVVPSGEDISNEIKNGNVSTLASGESYPIPALRSNCSIHVRPASGNRYQWSTSLPSYSWLVKTAHEKGNFEGTASKSMRPKSIGAVPIVQCKDISDGGGFYLKVIPKMSSPVDPRWRGITPWLDINLAAPIVLKNKLPGKLSYRVRQRSASSKQSATSDSVGLDLSSGIIDAMSDGHLHFSGESMHSTYISMAFENQPRSVSERPTRFGPGIRLDDLESGRVKAMQLSPLNGDNSRGTARRTEFRASVSPLGNGVSQFNFFAPFWLRNRSDTTVEVCSRANYYAAGTTDLTLRDRPPYCEPDQYVCFEGPYLSIRIPSKDAFNDEETGDLSSWWTCPSALDDLEKPVSFNISGRFLELDVRPALGYESNTLIVTIRNSSWIINYTPSILQWCQQTSLDKHGNCPTRLLHLLRPGSSQALHWDSKSGKQAVHLRLADENGESEWIWSQPVPLNIGHSRELPAKMYRPRTHDQYIARVDSKELSGFSRALVVCAEDRQNPPYRIVNRCAERAVAFWQIGSSERPWLVRAGKTSRYSWDDPLAPKEQRRLSIRILNKEDLQPSSPGTRTSKTPHAAPRCLNIDTVVERALEITEAGDPPVLVDVSVDGATKVITLYDFGSKPHHRDLPAESEKHSAAGASSSRDVPVPIIGLDDFGTTEVPNIAGVYHGQSPINLTQSSDYPVRDQSSIQQTSSQTVNSPPATATDAVVFLNSIGISVLDGAPSEIIYISSSGLLLRYESDGKFQSIALNVMSYQIDNQLAKTPYPVLLCVPDTQQIELIEEHPPEETSSQQNALAIEIHRESTDDDILMVNNFHASVRPFNIYFEEGLVRATLQFISDASVMRGGKRLERLQGPDDEYVTFDALGVMNNLDKRHRESATSSSQRLYVRDFKVGETSIRLTSTGSGAAIAKAAGLGSSARAIVGLLLNVENCDFEFAALGLENVFDSTHHFSVLVRQYYITQVENQRIKLLASNSLMGNPAALFDAVATGARDFISEPGRAKGSAEFIASVGRGSKSLLTHTVGGLVESVSSIPRAVSSGLEKAVGDNDYLAERERIRGSNLSGGHRGSAAKNPAQGLATGAISFAHGLSSGVTGLIREPVQGARQGGAGGLLKGIGKAVIGGLAKPVAGAIDLVAEPAAGLSRQMADSDRTNASNLVPVRPPRAFHGSNGRIELFDRRYSVGSWLFKAVEISTGTLMSSRLIGWVELSSRPERNDEDADWWVWKIVQRYSRVMPGAKRPPRRPSRSEGPPAMHEARPEKIRVALVTEEEVVIATLDCKLVTVIPLWRDARYELLTDGESLLVRQTIVGGEAEGGASRFLGLSTTQSLVAAPWDAATPIRRRKPDVDESVLERIACGSTAARDELRACIAEVTQRHGDTLVRRRASMGRPSASGKELSTLGWGGSKSGEEKSEMMRRSSSSTSGSRRRTREEGDRDDVDRIVRRLAKEGGNGGARVIVANKLPPGWELNLDSNWLESGRWFADLPEAVLSRSARVIELMKGDNGEAAGGLVFGAVRHDNGLADGQVQLDIFCGRDAAASFTTRAGETLKVSCERKRGANGTVVLTVRGGDGFGQGSTRQGSGGSGRGGDSSAGASGMSKDEKLIQQLVDIGFDMEDAVSALADAGGDLVRAVDILTTRQQQE